MKLMNPERIWNGVRGRSARYLDQCIGTTMQIPGMLLTNSVVRHLGPRIVTRAPSHAYARRQKPHLLILRNHFYAKGSAQISTEQLHLDNTLRECGLATFQTLTYDKDLKLSPGCDLQLIQTCATTRPSAIILSSWSQAMHQPRLGTIQFIREHMGIPVAALWWDTCSQNFGSTLEPLLEQFDTHVLMDNPRQYFINQNSPYASRIVPLWTPQCPSLFPTSVERDIPVSFLGQTSSYRSHRQEVIDHLVDQGINGYFSTKDRNAQVSHEEYAALLSRSKMSINFSYSVSSHQLKGRVFDVLLSGAMLLESENDQTSAFFRPMQEYVPFASKEDLVEKIGYFLKHEDELRDIAAQGKAVALKKYGIEQFWSQLLAKLELRPQFDVSLA